MEGSCRGMARVYTLKNFSMVGKRGLRKCTVEGRGVVVKEMAYHMRCHTSKKATQLVTKLPHGNNHLSAPNTSIYGFKAGLQPIFLHAPPSMYIARNEYNKAAGKYTIKHKAVFLKILTESARIRKALPGRCQ